MISAAASRFDAQLNLTIALLHAGEIEYTMGRTPEAWTYYRRGLELTTSLAASDPEILVPNGIGFLNEGGRFEHMAGAVFNQDATVWTAPRWQAWAT